MVGKVRTILSEESVSVGARNEKKAEISGERNSISANCAAARRIFKLQLRAKREALNDERLKLRRVTSLHLKQQLPNCTSESKL